MADRWQVWGAYGEGPAWRRIGRPSRERRARRRMTRANFNRVVRAWHGAAVYVVFPVGTNPNHNYVPPDW